MKTPSGILLLLLTLAGCATTRSIDSPPLVVAAEATSPGSADAKRVNRRLKPLERPQVRFAMERAVCRADSAWVVVRITVPHRSLRRGECFAAQCVLHTHDGFMELGEVTLDSGGFTPDTTGEVEFATRSGQGRSLYLSSRFVWDERMAHNADITVFARLTDGRHLFYYQPLTLPLQWCDDTEQGLFWPRSAGIPEDALLERSPFEAQ